MTEKQFWMKMDQLAGKSDNVGPFIELLRQAYDDNLLLPCGVHHQSPNQLQQLYINIDEQTPNRDGSRYMLCYTNAQRASGNSALPEHWEKLPVRFVINNALNKPVIGGLVFNHHDTRKFMVVPKQFLGSLTDMIRAASKATQFDPEHPDPFIFSK